MNNILADEEHATLCDFAKGHVLLAFDFDGTLAPIVRDPDAAALRPSTAKLLTEVARLYPCVVISGRLRADVMKKVKAIPLRAVIGNHGMEPSRNLRDARRLTTLWNAQLAAALPKIAGVVIEDKVVSLAVHYRKARSRTSVRRLLLIAAAALPGARIIEGKMVVNVLPAGAPDKGTALLDLRKRLHCTSAIYVGDDENDEDIFALTTQGHVLGIRVGRSRITQAKFFVPNQVAVDRLLAKLIDARKSTKRARPSTQSRRPATRRRRA